MHNIHVGEVACKRPVRRGPRRSAGGQKHKNCCPDAVLAAVKFEAVRARAWAFCFEGRAEKKKLKHAAALDYAYQLLLKMACEGKGVRHNFQMLKSVPSKQFEAVRAKRST